MNNLFKKEKMLLKICSFSIIPSNGKTLKKTIISNNFLNIHITWAALKNFQLFRRNKYIFTVSSVMEIAKDHNMRRYNFTPKFVFYLTAIKISLTLIKMQHRSCNSYLSVSVNVKCIHKLYSRIQRTCWLRYDKLSWHTGDNFRFNNFRFDNFR